MIDQPAGPLCPTALTPRKLTVTTHRRRPTQSPQPGSHWLSLAVTNSPCCTNTQKPMLSNNKKGHTHNDASVNQSSIRRDSHFVEVFVWFFFLDFSTLSGGKRETIQENKLTLELWSRRVPGKQRGEGWGCFSVWSFSGNFSKGSGSNSAPNQPTQQSSCPGCPRPVFASQRLPVCVD